jgi:hypothetical protein
MQELSSVTCLLGEGVGCRGLSNTNMHISTGVLMTTGGSKNLRFVMRELFRILKLLKVWFLHFLIISFQFQVARFLPCLLSLSNLQQVGGRSTDMLTVHMCV